MVGGRKMASVIRLHVNGKHLQLECARVLYDSQFESILIYGETIVQEEKKRSKIWVTLSIF